MTKKLMEKGNDIVNEGDCMFLALRIYVWEMAKKCEMCVEGQLKRRRA